MAPSTIASNGGSGGGGGVNRQFSYTPLTLPPIDLNLTAGTDIPAPTPPRLPSPPPPQSPPSGDGGGGPLTSHPTTPDTVAPASQPQQHPHGPLSPTSASNNYSTSPRRSSGVRKLLSLSSLKSSFSNASRSSLLLSSTSSRPSHDHHHHHHHQYDVNGQQQQGVKRRPSSPSVVSTVGSTNTTATGLQARPRPPKKTSGAGGWLRRKSGFFGAGGDWGGALDAVEENQGLDTAVRDSKRVKAPVLPEIGTLGGVGLGWNEEKFVVR